MQRLFQKFLCSIAVSAAMLQAPVAIADAVAAKKDGVEVLAEPQKGSNVIKTLKKDEAVESGERKGMFWEVKVGGGLGYVSVLNVKREAAAGKLDDVLRSAVTEGRESGDESQNRSRSAVMGVRGLDSSDETSFAGNAKPNLTLVYQMEDLRINPTLIEQHQEAVMKEVETKAK